MDNEAGNQHHTETTAGELVTQCYTDYGIHTHKSKISNVIDGLKPINRRILLVQNSQTKKKGPEITGVTMGTYHPYGDMAIGAALIRMAQGFKTRTKLMHCDMKTGDYYGAEAPALRYLGFKASNFAIDVYYKGIDHNVFEFIPTEVGNGELEPKFFIPKLPMALLVASLGIGVAHKSSPINVNVGDLCRGILQYIKLITANPNITKEELNTSLAKYLLPEYPMAVLLRNRKEVLGNYKQGLFKTSLYEDGLIEVTPTTIVIRTLPNGNIVKDVWARAGNDRRNVKANFINRNIQRIEDYSKLQTEADVTFTLKRGVNPFTILEEFKKYIGFSKRNTPINLYTLPNDHLGYLSPVEVISLWYRERSRAIKAELRAKQRKYAEQIRVINVFIKVGDNIHNVVKVLMKSETIDEAYPILSKNYDLSKAQVDIIAKYRLANVLKRGRANLLEELESIKEDVKELQENFINVDSKIANDCKMFINKYPEYCSRNCDTDHSIGCVTSMGGVMQFNDLTEMHGLLCQFGKYPTEVTIYPIGNKHKYLLSSSGVIDESKVIIPKQIQATSIVSFKHLPKYTIGLGVNPKTIFRHNHIAYADVKNLTFTHVGDECTVIHYNGLVETIKTTSLVSRASIKSLGIRSDIIHVSDITSETIVIAHTHKKNEVILEFVKQGASFLIPPRSVAKTTILGIYNPNNTIVINVPKESLNKCLITKVLVEAPLELQQTKYTIKLNTKSQKDLVIRRTADSNLMEIK